MIRLFVPHDLGAGQPLALDEGQSRYLAAVMRVGAGDEIAVFNGRDGEWRARVAKVGKRSVSLEVEAALRAQAAGPDLDLIVALVKRARLETIVEKAAELGARRVRPVITERTNADHTRVDRLQAIAVEASEQTGRLDVPQVLEPVKLERMLGEWEEGRRLLFCDEAGDAQPVLEALSAAAAPPPPFGSPSPAGGGGFSSGRPQAAIPPPPAGEGDREAVEGALPLAGRWAILIGPEGGFSPREREALRALPYATPASLGPRILRADTAAISALTLWQAAAGDWR